MTSDFGASVRAGGKLCLVVVTEGNAVTQLLPAAGEVLIGRSETSTVRLAEKGVSRDHARIYVGEKVEIEDLGSSNGTLLGGVRLEPHARAPMPPGSVVEIGSTMILLQMTAPSSAKLEAVGANDVARVGVAEQRTAPNALLDDPSLAGLCKLVERLARGSISILLLGETGVGKEVFARVIHQSSPRRLAPFVRINCAALVESLAESELFGHARGAFTGAADEKKGLLEAAEGGTVFLDELGEMALPLQAKMLRAIEQKQIQRVGSVEPRPIDVRFVAATNRDLPAEVARGGFRSDLYFRLNGVTLVIPPLRDRRSQIKPLAEHFLRLVCAELGRGVPKISPAAVTELEAHVWPGNVRELRNVIERAALLSAGAPIEPEHLSIDRLQAQTRPAPAPATITKEDSGLSPSQREEKQKMEQALSKTLYNVTRAAKEIGMPLRTFHSKMQRYRIPRPRGRENSS